jgi:hypothetical protein
MLAESSRVTNTFRFSLGYVTTVDKQGCSISATGAVQSRLLTLRTALSDAAFTSAVKKWDKQGLRAAPRTGIPRVTFPLDRFSKACTALEALSATIMSPISTFTPRTTATTSTFISFMLFLRSPSHPKTAVSPSHKSDPDIHTPLVAQNSSRRPRIKTPARAKL